MNQQNRLLGITKLQICQSSAKPLAFLLAPSLLGVVRRQTRKAIGRHIADPSVQAEASTRFGAGCKRILLSDNCLYALQPSIPHLTRSASHRCLQRHGISRLPDVGGDKLEKRKFKTYPIGYFHIDIAEVRTKEGKLHLFVAIDRASKFAFVQLHGQADLPTAVSFLEELLEAAPYRLHRS
jgi:hypothetical protein